jgi:REP element-mobilizing transposase RayT
MPDHVHAILWIVKYNFSSRKALAPITTVVGVWKSLTARHINLIRRSEGKPVWQRNYFERIVRDRQALAQIRAYIRRNRESFRDHEPAGG